MGDGINVFNYMPSLNWIGKEKIVNHDKDVPFRLMRKNKKYSLGNSENLIVEGDNLEALKALMPFYYGKIKCIYIDPPYNTGNEGWKYNDRVNAPKIREWLGKVVGSEGEDLTRHDKWLCMMYPRLKLLRDLLSDDGVIYVQLDYNEVHYGKLLMDEIFGRDNFQREIIWRIGWVSGYKSADQNWIRNHDSILFYSKNYKKLKFIKKYNTASEYLERFNGETIKDIFKYLDRFHLNSSKKKEFINFISTIGLPNRYPIEDTWNSNSYDKLNSIAIVSFSGEKVSKLLHVKEFKGQKSISLIKRIIRAHTGDNDIILDSFAGTGSTGHAVLDLNKEDGGNRKFILVEMEKNIAKKITAERMKKVIKIYEYKKNDGIKIQDCGFEYVELGELLFDKDGMINKSVRFEDMARYVYFTETRTNLEKKNIEGNYLGEFGDNHYFLLFNGIGKNILDRKFLKELKPYKGKKIVYADKCLLDEEVLEKYQIVFKQIPYQVKIY
jgi:DNA modification methylase